MKRILRYSSFLESTKINLKEVESWFLVKSGGNSSIHDIKYENDLYIFYGNVILDGIFNGDLNLPIQIDTVYGKFSTKDNELKNLNGCPNKILKDEIYSYEDCGSFNCSFNPLEDLSGCPNVVDGDFDMIGCGLKSLSGISKVIGGDLNISRNNIEDFTGLNDLACGGDIYANNNPNLYSFNGLPELIKNKIYINKTPLFELWNLMDRSEKALNLSISYNFVRKIDGEWVLLVNIFEDICDECGINLPNNWKDLIKNYKLHE